MKFRILRYQPGSPTVSVRFEHDGIIHRRPVNACFDGEGNYDPAATAARVADVANGVKVKIEMGLFSDDPA